MNTKILATLIKPPFKLTEDGMHYNPIPPPLGIAYIAAYAREHGFSVNLLDALAEGWNNIQSVGDGFFKVGLSDEEIVNRLRELKPDIVGITNPFTSQSEYMFHVAKLVKDYNPSIYVVVGGVHPTCLPKDCMMDKNIDFLVVGEGEKPFVEILEYLAGKRKIESLKSTYYRRGDDVIFNGVENPIRDIDSIPFPAYDLLPMDKYFDAGKEDSTVRGGHHNRWSMILTSRGCPFKCSFCGANMLNGNVWRGRTPEKVIEELQHLISAYNVDRFTIEDSNFTFDMARAEKICDLIIERKLNITWTLPNGLRADKLNRQLVEKMKAAGCVEITIAVEHGDQDFLNNVVHKHLDLKTVEKSVKTISDAGIPVSGFFILGIPPETKKTAEKTYKFAVKLARLGMTPQIGIAIPLPATEMADRCLKDGLIKRLPTPDEYLRQIQCRPLIHNSEIPDDYLVSLRRKTFIVCGLTLLLYHPRLFFKFPFVQQTLRDFTNPNKIYSRISKLLSILNLERSSKICPN
jgi:magnesium-protoporphyrin IX monomethyl ester (oxidative) cyclase